MTSTDAAQVASVNPLAITLLLPIIRWGLTVAGVSGANATTGAPQVLSGLVAIASLAWGLWSWLRSHSAKVAAIQAPAAAVVTKLHL